MGNVLDLKNPETVGDDGATTTDVVTPAIVPASAALPSFSEFAARTIAAAAAPQAISWEAHHPLQGRAWQRHYTLMAVLVFVGGAVAWWQSSIAVMVVTLLGAATWELRERLSRPVSVAVDNRGIEIDGRRVAHADLTSFDIHRMPDDTVELSLQTRRWHIPTLRLPLGEQDPTEVKTVLAQYIIEAEHPVPLLDAFIRKP